MLYSVHSIALHRHVVVENVDLVPAICVKTLMSNRYGFECAIYDEDGYLVSAKEQNDALEKVYEESK